MNGTSGENKWGSICSSISAEKNTSYLAKMSTESGKKSPQYCFLFFQGRVPHKNITGFKVLSGRPLTKSSS